MTAGQTGRTYKVRVGDDAPTLHTTSDYGAALDFARALSQRGIQRAEIREDGVLETTLHCGVVTWRRVRPWWS